MNEFGNYLFELRRKKGMTQQELADELGVTNKAVSNWETGETFPETKQLIPLADISGVSVDDLLRGRESAAETKSPLSAQEQTAEKREIIIEKYLPDWWKKTFCPAYFRRRRVFSRGSTQHGILFSCYGQPIPSFNRRMRTRGMYHNRN